MKRLIRERIKARLKELELKKKDLEDIKDSMTNCLKLAFLEVVPSGRYEGKTGIEALPLLYRDVVFGITGASKAQQSAIMRMMDQFIGRGEVAAEAKEIAAESGPKVLYVGGARKEEPKTINAEIVHTLPEGTNVS